MEEGSHPAPPLGAGFFSIVQGNNSESPR